MKALVLAAALLVPAAAQADDCDRATNQNQLNACAEDNYRRADGELNQTWSTLPDDAKSRLRPEQRDWIAARDSKCKTTAAEAEGGSMYPLLYFGCLTEETKARTRRLKTVR